MTVYRCCADVAMTEVEDPEGPIGVLLNLKSRRYFTLNSTGLFVWKALAEAPRDPEVLVDEVVRAFVVDRERAASSVRRLLGELSQEHLVEPQI